ncbi:DUF2207 domain-containing protein [Streptomyces sp. KHY 26]|uniref:DUF2207 domain-containing protein n=1 Tax=Streptomyces sp. KHY 26 TaxID=3097359 RepID=UPI00376EA905
MGTERDGDGPRPGAHVRGARVRSLIRIFLLALVLGVVVAVARNTFNTERVTTMWVGARIAADGSARITEVVDYDFGYPDSERHGIYRDLPDLPYDEDEAHVTATMDGHRVPWELTAGDDYTEPDGERETATRIQVGDPDRAVTGVHRYRVQYTLQGVVKNGGLAWDAVGTGWRVDRSRVEIHVLTPYPLAAPRCVHGTDGSEHACALSRPGPRELTVRLDRLKGREGVTLFAGRGHGASGVAAEAPAPPAGKAVGTTVTHPLLNALLALGLALAAALVTIPLLRLAGRDRPAPGDTDPGTPGPTPPPGLNAAQGGLLVSERVEARHQTAWLLGAVAEGHLVLGGETHAPTLRRRAASAGAHDPVTEDVLQRVFAGRREVVLGAYDPWFQEGWEALAGHLTRWREESGLWEAASLRRARTGRYAGVAASVLGFVVAAVGAALGGGRHTAGGPLLIAGAVVFGAGLASARRAWELQRRTPEGSARWLRVESFRRYLADPAAFPGTEPLDEDQVRHCTAWAVALDLAADWREAVENSAVPTRQPSSRTVRLGPALAWALVGTAVASARSPSSGGSSGGSPGGGGSSSGVGGGAGGGGGGSW